MPDNLHVRCFLHSVDCEMDTEAEGFIGTRNNSALNHGTVTSFSCDSEHCSRPNFCSNACIRSRTCYNGTWIGVFPTCTGTLTGAVNFNTSTYMYDGKGFVPISMLKLL